MANKPGSMKKYTGNNMLPKTENFKTSFKNYSDSLKDIFNILSISQTPFPNKKSFNFMDIEYNSCINKKSYEDWVCRHAFIEVIELTREFLLYTFSELFSSEVSFEDQKKIHGLNKKNHLLTTVDILTILGLADDFSSFCDDWNKNKDVRNCLAHRFGRVAKYEKPPVTLVWPKRFYFIKTNDDELECDNLKSLLNLINQVETDRTIGIKNKKQENAYSDGEQIIINHEIVFGVARFLFGNVKKIVECVLKEHILGLMDIYENSDLFKGKMIFYGVATEASPIE